MATVEDGTFRQRLLDGLAASIEAVGYHKTTVADIVRLARTSRRTFYEHFAGKEECLVALLTESNAELIRAITAAIDETAPWQHQIRQAVDAWINTSEADPATTLSWIRDVPSLGLAARALQRDTFGSLTVMIQAVCDTPRWRAAGISPPSRQLTIMLLGGLRELIATTVEDGGRVSDITETAVRALTALLGSCRVPSEARTYRD